MAPPHTPLRRVSQGSLRALSRSGMFPDAPEGLGFLESAMDELAHEADTTYTNLSELLTLSNSIERFNNSFASYLYVMEMNSLTTDWPQAPMDVSFALAKRRAEEDARAAIETAAAAAAAVAAAEAGTQLAATDEGNDNTDKAITTAPANNPKQPSGSTKSSVLAKKSGKPKMSAKEKKERNMMIDKVVMNLPLDFRGQDPTLRRHVETVIETLMDNPGGLELLSFVRPPDLNQARVNKCLLALMNRKIVSKDNSSGRILYIWNGVPN